MSDFERVRLMYDLILGLVVSGKKVKVVTQLFSVEFFEKNKVFYAKTEKVTASADYLHSLYDLVKYSIAEGALGGEIDILINGKSFAVIK